jgi:His/Glu/Gln/Arg/opine family amino acid ABC transporter permease subunit
MKTLTASLRFIAMVLGIVLVFGLGGSLILAAFDKQQTHSQAPLFDLGTILHGVTHFLQTLIYAASSGTNHVGTPYWTFFLTGLATTIEFCFISMPLALTGGFFLALMSQSKLGIVRRPVRAFVEFIRNTPLLVQMQVIYLGLAPLPHWLVNPLTAGIATLVINYCAYESENLRAGLAAIDRGQGEAAATLGLSQAQTLRLVLLPQMIPISLPTVINDFIYMFKDSSILSLIAILELTAQTRGLARLFPVYAWQFYTIGAILYLALSLPLGRLARQMEARLRKHTFAQGRDLTSLAWQTLILAVVAGWIAGALAVGFSFGSLWSLAGQIGAGIMLTLVVLIGVMVIVGGPVYVIGSLVALVRQDKKRGGPPPPTSIEPDSALAIARK